MKRYKISRRLLIFWCLFIGIGAVAGSFGMLCEPDGSALGMAAMLPYFQVLPFANKLFQNFIFSGISLLIVNGISNLTAAILLLKNKKAGIICGTIFGLTLMAWITIQFVIFPLNFMSTIYFVFGIIQALTGFACYVFYRQLNESLDVSKYTQIGTNKKALTVYFSRLGRVKKIAYETADKCGSDIFELQTSELTKNTSGFWWCGRFGMHKWSMPVIQMPDIEKYDKIIICTPIWVFSICAPIRDFCKRASGKIKSVEYISVHFQIFKYKKVFDEMDSILKIKRDTAKSFSCPLGKSKMVYSEENTHELHRS